jgi:predicted dehydrogenase
MGRIRLETIDSHPDTVAVVAHDPANRSIAGDLTVVDDVDTLLAHDIDAVFVCTPNRVTPDVVCAALDAGKHVFSEKPPGRTVEDIERIMEAEARNPGLTLKFGFNHRHHLGIIEAKSIIDSQRYGRVLWARGVYGKGERLVAATEWRNDPHEAGGGILLDQGIHMLDLLRYVLGDFVEIKSMCTNAFWDSPLEDNAFALLRTAEGRIGMLHSSFTQWKHLFRLEVGFSDGYLVVDGMPSSTRSYRDERITHARRRTGVGFTVGNPPEESLFFNVDPSWDLELAEFVECVDRGIPVAHGSSSDAHAAMLAVRAIYEDDQKFGPQLAEFRPVVEPLG